MSYDVIEREETVIVIDPDTNKHEFSRRRHDETQLEAEQVDEETIEWVEENTEFSVTEEPDFKFPAEVSYGFHLEDSVDYKAAVEYGKEFERFVDGFRFPSVSLVTKWKIDKNGRFELIEVEYNGVTFTPE